MNKKRLFLLIFTTLLIVGGIIVFNFYTKIYTSNTYSDSEFYISSKSDFNSVMEKISPLLKNKKSFKWVAEKKNYPNTIKAGRYIIKGGMNNNELVNLLRSGKQTPIKLSFNNQETIEKLAGRISEQIEPDSITILKVLKNRQFLKENNFTKETALGMYIPNSYEFYWNTTPEKFRHKMLQAYHTFWNSSRKNLAKKQGLTINQVITLASIVQKETATVSERPRVAGLYLNRYHNKWTLQADPTIIFILKQQLGQDAIIKRVLLKDLKINSAYNTYRNIGIPPGPISMPDISSIDAVLKPEKHDYFYMCANIEDIGKHAFAKSLSQHNRNAAKYQQWLNKQGVNR